MYMLYGPAGSGKSTQGQILAQTLGGTWLSAGQISRDHFAEYTHTAAMVPEPNLAAAILTEVEQAERLGRQVVFDGQPWSPEGATILQDIGLLPRVQTLFILNVPRAVSLERLRSRGRADDQAENWRRKLDMYEARMLPFLQALSQYHVPVVEIDGAGTVEEVSKQILAHLPTKP